MASYFQPVLQMILCGRDVPRMPQARMNLSSLRSIVSLGLGINL